MTTAGKVRSLREHRRNILQAPLKDVANRAGISISLLSLIERGVPFAPWKIKNLARGYRLSVSDIERLVGAHSVGEQK